MAEVSEDVVELAAGAVADGLHIVSEQAEAAEQLVRSLNAVKFQFTLIGIAVGSATGAVIAYNVAYRKAGRKFEKIAQAEIEQMRSHFLAKEQSRQEDERKGELEETVQRLGYIPYSDSETGVVAPTPPVVPRPETAEPNAYTEAEQEAIDQVVAKEERNIFSPGNLPDWDYTREKKLREGRDVYVIHIDERFETSADSVSAVFYEADGVLCNEKDDVLELNEVIGGLENLRFGEGSGDPSIVFVRNEKLMVEFEIVKDEGSYAETVHGLQHSDEPRSRRRSRDWDG